MALLLCGAALLRRLAKKLHKQPPSSFAAAAATAAVVAASGCSAAAADVSSSAAAPGPATPGSAVAVVTTTTTTTNINITTILRSAAAAARAAGIIPRKALPSIPFCSNDEYTLAQLLGMKAPPASYWALPPVNPLRISALSRDGNPPAACSSLPAIEEDDEPVPESIDSIDDDNALSRCFSACSSLAPGDCSSQREGRVVPPVDPLFTMLWAKVQREVGEESDDDDNDDDDDDENCSCSTCLHDLLAVQEKCSALLSSSGALAREKEPTFPVMSSPRLSSSSSFPLNAASEPVGVEQALDSSFFLRPAPLSIRKKVVEDPPVAHPEPLRRVLVTYDRGATHCMLHPTLDALCLHLNA